jgi:hypothetical protein
MSVDDIPLNGHRVRRIHDNLYQEVSSTGDSEFFTQEQLLERESENMTEDQIAELRQKLLKISSHSVVYHPNH